MTNEEAKGRLESFIDTFNICKEHDNSLVAVSISKEDIQAFTQAIKALETVSCIKEKCAYCPHCENCDVDDETLKIKALEQQPCEDAVNRQEVLEQTYNWSKDEFLRITNPFDYLRKRINSLSSVTPKEKTGKWIMEDMFDGDVAYRCSECNELFWIESGTPKDNEYNFCPNCGARMVSE